MKPFLATLSAAFVALALGTSFAHAADITAPELTALKARITAFDQAVETNDVDAIESVVPPRLIASMAQQFGRDPDDLKADMRDAMARAMSQVTVVSYNMALDQATFNETPQGRAFALIPSRIVMKVDGTTMQGDNHTLAFADEGAWYLVRIDDANQVRFLVKAYPEFKDVAFPSGTMAVIED